MSTLMELRLQAGLSVARLAKLADVDRKTVERAEKGQPIQDTKAYAIVSTLAQQLGKQFSLRDVEGLNIL